jgi:glycine cleavage system H lipoate-binding protein/ABC-type phosphate transport system substrate-binding protein
MKKAIYLLIGILLMNYSYSSSMDLVRENNSQAGDSLKIFSTPDLYNLSIKWAEEYNKVYPDKKIKVVTVSDTKLVSSLIEKGNNGFVSSAYYSEVNSESLWKVIVGRDVIVPVINSKNPYLNEISQHGISPEALSSFLNSKGSKNWGTLLKNNQNSPVHYYWINDESVSKGLAGFLKTDPTKQEGIKVENGESMIAAIQKDPLAIGFCKMVNIIDFNKHTIAENIKLLPLDRNGNGMIDYNEKIYDDFNGFSRGVWIGKYPKTLFSNIYSVSLNPPNNETEIAFMKWVLTDGQQFLYNNGYTDLLASERLSTVDKLYEAKVYPGAPGDKSMLKSTLAIISVLILIGLIINFILRLFRNTKSLVKTPDTILHPVLDENTVIVPAGLYFDKTHTWAFMEQNGIVKVGIDDFMQHITGAITRIKMKDKGEQVKKGESILSIIQNGKQLNLYSPVSGIIKELNTSLDTNSSIINSSPYNEGWVYMIEPSNWLRENQLLFMADKQRQYIKSEFSRLKDFLAAALKAGSLSLAPLVLQDGGELRDGVLSNLGPEEWEDFQTKFIDPSRQIWFYELY